MRDVWEYIKSFHGKIFVYGCGNGGDKLISYLESLKVKIDGIAVSDGFSVKKLFHGFVPRWISELKEEHPGALFLMAFGTKITEPIFSLKNEINLLYPEVPVFGSEPFTEKMMEEKACH